MSQNTVEPLERTVKMQLNPARSGGDRLTAILCAPALYETHADGAHPGQLVYGLETLAHRLREKRGELLVVEYLQITP